MKKRILSFLTLLCMITALFPTNITVFASTVDSGTCGDNLTWTLTDDGTLTISGTGKMEDWVLGSYVPWYSSCKNITSVIISGGVTHVGDYSFDKCSNLTSVTIGNSVTSIGDNAFYYCTGLTNVTIPDSVTTIGRYAFYNTGIYNDKSNWDNDALYIGNYLIVAKDSLSGEYNVKSGTTRIGDAAFFSCNRLTSVIIPASVTSIGERAFACVGLKNINVDENNIKYCAVDGILFNKAKTELVQYATSKKDTQYAIPNSVTSIGDSAFYFCLSLTSITMPDNVASIGWGAFNSCKNLTSITIPNSVTNIGNYAFLYCSSLKNVHYNGTKSDWNKISIGSNNDYLTNATRTYFAYINFFDKSENKMGSIMQNIGETVDLNSIEIPDGYVITNLYKDKEMTKEYSLDTPIRENLNLYCDIIKLNKLKITGVESADIGQKGITESITFATDKTAKDFVATIKYSDKLNLSAITEKDFSITENLSETKNGYTYLYLTCTYKNDGNMPKNTTLNPFDLVFDVSESTTANEKLTIEFVSDDNDETYLALGSTGYDFDSLGKAEIKVNPISVKSITINGADEIDKATQYTTVISPENATNKDIEWTIDNSDIATISQDGTLTPVKAGTVKIKATAKDGSGISSEKSVTVKVYAQITSLSANVGVWNKSFTPTEREYIIYVPKSTSIIKIKPTHNSNGTLEGTTTLTNGKNNNFSLNDTETVLTLTYSQTGYTDSEYKIKIVKFEGTKTTVSDNGTKFTVIPINIKGGTVILALYNGDTFVEMQSKPYTDDDIPFTTDKAYTIAKVMVWDSLESMTPICDVEIVKLK